MDRTYRGDGLQLPNGASTILQKHNREHSVMIRCKTYKRCKNEANGGFCSVTHVYNVIARRSEKKEPSQTTSIKAVARSSLYRTTL